MPELLRGDSGNFGRRIAFASRFYGPAYQRRQKLCVETAVAAGDVVVCRWWLHLSHQIFTKAIFRQTLPNLLSGRGQLRLNGNLGIQGSQGFIVKRLRQRMQAVEPVRSAAEESAMPALSESLRTLRLEWCSLARTLALLNGDAVGQVAGLACPSPD